jgi:uncharacterized protein
MQWSVTSSQKQRSSARRLYVTKYVLLYESADDVRTKAPAYAAEHRAWWQQYLKAGTLLMIGPFSDPQQGAMGIFASHEAAESFAIGDPFVVNGVVKSWVIKEWHEALVN